jgi:hypothetical protein
MKRMLVIGTLILALGGGAWAHTYGLATFQDSFAIFANEVANSLPATASIGTWSPAYIGQFPPHFGVGITAGAVFIPYSAIEDALGPTMLNVTLPSQLDFIKRYGIPFPAAAIDGRIGGFFFPFDLGVRVGFIPEAARQFLGKVNVDYLMVGGDIRLPILKDHGFVPALSVGAGYTYLRGGVGMPDALGTGPTTVDLVPQVFPSGTHVIQATAPDLAFSWQTSTFTAKVQVSKNLLIFTPHIGLGAAYGISKAGGGIQSSIQYDEGSGFAAITDAQIAAIKQAYEDAGYITPDISADGFLVKAEANGYSFWVYGGTAINIFFIKLDLSAMYNLLTRSYGASVNLRLQL